MQRKFKKEKGTKKNGDKKKRGYNSAGKENDNDDTKIDNIG